MTYNRVYYYSHFTDEKLRYREVKYIVQNHPARRR